MVQRLRVAGVSFAVMVCVIFAPAAWAQTSGSATIAGLVTDSSSAVMPGVTVEAASPALIEKVRAVVTDAQGQYKIVDLRPGTYTVTFSLSGFSTVRREGVELTPNVTANVGAEMRVGDIQETLTVSGASPVVDVQAVAQTQTLSQTLLDTLPTAKTMLGFAALTPSVVGPPTAQDVGGSKGEVSVRMLIHGGHASDQKLMLDGMRINTLAVAGTGRGFFFNPGSAEEITVELAGGGVGEYDTGGVHVNMVPKDGGNRFNAYFFSTYTDHHMQATNLDDTLRARGLHVANNVDNIYDINGAGGGPILQDKLWFYSAARHWGESLRIADLYHDATEGSPVYTPDLSQPAYAYEWSNSENIRFTWQATPKDKVTALWDVQNNCWCTTSLASGGAGGTSVSGATALEAVGYQRFAPQYVIQSTWARPQTSKVLFEAGATLLVAAVPTSLQSGVSRNDISTLEASTGFLYNAPSSYTGGGHPSVGQTNERFSVSYVTGSHNFKSGLFVMHGVSQGQTVVNQNVNYTFLNGAPISLTEFATPINTVETVKADLGLYAQDQWTIRRLTLNLGLRFDYLNVYDSPTTEVPNRFISSPRSFPGLDCVPCWKDLNPRLAAAYDLFGTGKTAVKGSIGRYVASETTTLADAFNPANAVASSVTRPWTDTNHNFIPDCDLTSPLANGECGKMSNALFGQSYVTTHADPSILTGWEHRPYNWQVSASIQQQLMSRVAVSGGYYRTWYGNFSVTDNLDVTPADYSPYCITAPMDPRLPGGGGNQICGLYDLNPSKVGQVNNFVTFASNFGKQTEVYNGVDANLSAQLPRGARLSGGINVGNEINGGGVSGAAGGVSHTNNCDVVTKVNNPSTRFCDVVPLYKLRLKIFGSYPLPWWDLTASATFQSLPGAPISATYVATNAQIAPSLGRNLSGGSTASIPLIAPYTQFDSRVNQLDVRLTKSLKFGRHRVQGNLDVYNALNANPVTAEVLTYGAAWQKPVTILDARLFKFSAQFEF